MTVMILTAALALLLLLLAVTAQANLTILHTPVSLRFPGFDDLPLSYLRMLVGIGGSLVLLWVAGLLDLAVMGNRLRRRDALVRAKDLEIAQLKAAAYDRHQAGLDDIKIRVEGLDEELNRVFDRLETVSLRTDRIAARDPAPPIAPRSDRVAREEVVRDPTVAVENRIIQEDAPAPGLRKTRRWYFLR